MSFYRDLYAGFQIFCSNFTAQYGVLVNWLLAIGVVALIALSLTRAVLAGKTHLRQEALNPPEPDPDLTGRACDSLSKAVRIPTVTGDAGQMQAYVEFLKTQYQGTLSRLKCLFLPGGSMLLHWRAASASERKPVLFCGHLDVAPAGEGWRGDPFSGKREDGVIRGRGTIDCKNVVISLLEAVTALMDEGFAPKRDLYFAFGHDEETGGQKGAAEIAKLLNKRGVSFDLVLDEGSFIAKAHMGSKTHPAALLGVGEKGYCIFKLTAGSKPGHTSMPPQHTALGYLAEAICRIEAAPPRARLLPTVREHLRLSAPAMKFSRRFAVANLPVTKRMIYRMAKGDRQLNALLRTTFAATQASASPAPNVLPATAEAVLTVRVLQGDTVQSVREYLEALLSDLPVKITLVLESDPSPITQTRSPLYGALCSAVEARFPGVPCIPTILPSGTDATHYQGLSDNIVRFMPFVVSNQAAESMHGPNEYVRESSVGAAVEVYRDFMRKL